MVPQLKQWTVSIFFWGGGGCYPRGLLHHNLIGTENLLRRYDTIKTCRWNFFKFPELFIKGKYVKIRFKNRESPCYFLSSRSQKIKNITKLGKKLRLILFTFFVSVFMAFLAQKLIYTINIWFNFVFGSFFEQDHLLNLFILGVYAKRWPKCARISIQKLM